MHIERQDSAKAASCGVRLAAAVFALGAAGCAHKAPPLAPAPEAARAMPQPAAAPAPVVEQPALDRLQAMSDTLAAAKAFAYRSRSRVEVPARTGQFLTHFVESEVALERPNKLRSTVTGDLPHFQFFYDGATVSALDIQKNLYATAKAPGTIDEMLPFVMEKAGIDFASADFLVGNPYAELTKGLTHAIVVGPAKVNGVPCEHYAFMGPAANWEIWIDADALPRRLATTHKTLANFPRFQVEFLDWNLRPKPGASQFVFNKPQGAQAIEFGPRAENPPQ
jgi:hypothetical protein